MAFLVFLSFVAIFGTSFGVRSAASGASRLCRAHRHGSIFVDFDHIAPRVCTARETSETFRSAGDDRVGVGAGLDHVTLLDLPVEERVEADLPRAFRIDLAHDHEYRKSAPSADMM